jgi:ribonuclease HI
MTNASNGDPAVISRGRHYRLITDGACPRNPGNGGWAVLIQLKDGDKLISQVPLAGFGGCSTNNQMEMLAAIKGLQSLDEPDTPAVVLTDSQLVQMGMTEWLPRWKFSGWKGQKKIANRALWEQLDGLASFRTIAWVKVRGHSGHPENELVDNLAVAASRGAFKATGSLYRLHPELFFDGEATLQELDRQSERDDNTALNPGDRDLGPAPSQAAFLTDQPNTGKTQHSLLPAVSGVLYEFMALRESVPAQLVAIFLVIAQKPGIHQRELGEKIGRSQSSISRNVSKLCRVEANGTPGLDLVKKSIDPCDKSHQLFLTTKGKALAGRLGRGNSGLLPATEQTQGQVHWANWF